MGEKDVIGLTASVKAGEVPPGLTRAEFEAFGQRRLPQHRQVDAVSDDHLYEVGGWWWLESQLEFE